MKPFKKIILFAIIIGVFSFVINLLFGENTSTLIMQDETNGIIFYKIDIWTYIQNINNNLGDTTQLTIKTQTRVWTTGQWDSLINDLAFIVNILITFLNILIYPIRIGGYVLKTALTIFGLDVRNNAQHNLKWLIDFLNILIPLQIPFI